MEVFRAIEIFSEPSDMFLQVGEKVRRKSSPGISQAQSTRKQVPWQGRKESVTQDALLSAQGGDGQGT